MFILKKEEAPEAVLVAKQILLPTILYDSNL